MYRREFLKGTTAVLASACGGRDRPVPPTARLGIGMIGVGGFGTGHLAYLLENPRFEVRAVADPEMTRVEAAVARTRGRALGYRDYRELLARDDVDAVVIATPDHWHAKVSIDAANAGKHVYCEKPVTVSVAEGRAMVDAVRANDIAFQTGSHQRSIEHFQLACEIVRNGRIGQLQRMEVMIPAGPVTPPEPANPQPETLDWDLWLGPAPSATYHQLRAAGTFRYFRDYGGGTITDLGAHELDIAQWGAGRDATSPATIVGTGTFEPGNFFESATVFDVRYTYNDGLELRLRDTTGIWSIQFFGTDGDILVAPGGILQASRPELLDYELGSGAVVLENSRDHHANWADAILEGTLPICDVEIGHRSATLCHLANIAIETGRTLTFDPIAERFMGDPAADMLLSRPYREGWEL